MNTTTVLQHDLRGLYLITPNWDDTEHLLVQTELALQAGVGLLQYRHKTASKELRQTQATKLHELCRRYEVPLIINDHIYLCLDLDAEGIHVGGTDISVAQARALVGADKIVGASCYGDLQLARDAQKQGATYVAFGGFYPSLVKQYPVTTKPDIIVAAKNEITLPIVVIGGMNVALAGPLVHRGADMVAAISSVYNAINPDEVCKEFIALFQ
ncbi:thiamine phosphate synthase [Undibacterium sp. Di24W]|uniref:thiamine phosphate synthase n=1 Tax=Undibacterium sp. Di24W TaxID=3413033 RepID=UPI003BF25AD4